MCHPRKPSAAQIQASQRILSQLQEQISGEEASSALNWFRVDTILESASLSPNTKFYALQILENAIKFRWKTLPPEQCIGIKTFIVNLVIARSSNEETYRAQKLFMSKLNVILVQIVKQDWPHNWPSCAPPMMRSHACPSLMRVIQPPNPRLLSLSPPCAPAPNFTALPLLRGTDLLLRRD